MKKSNIKNPARGEARQRRQKSKIKKTARKRFKITKKGKFVAGQSHFSHLRSKRSAGQKLRKKRKIIYEGGKMAKKIRQLVSS